MYNLDFPPPDYSVGDVVKVQKGTYKVITDIKYSVTWSPDGQPMVDKPTYWSKSEQIKAHDIQAIVGRDLSSV